MAQVYSAPRSFRIALATPPALFRSKGITSVKSGFPSSRRIHFRSTAQSIRASENVSRSAAAAGRACTLTPSEPRRTSRNRRSDIVVLAHTREQVARRMPLGVADDCNADPEQACELTLRDSSDRVVSALGMNVGLQFTQE